MKLRAILILFSALCPLAAGAQEKSGMKIVGYADGKPLYVTVRVPKALPATQPVVQRTVRRVQYSAPVRNRVNVGACTQCYGQPNSSTSGYQDGGFYDPYGVYGQPFSGYPNGYGVQHQRCYVPQGPGAFPGAASRGYVNIPRYGTTGTVYQAPRYAP
jgi:hypothetical protein